MATLESKKAATLGKRSIIGMIIGLALGAILCFVPNGYVRDDIVINTIMQRKRTAIITARMTPGIKDLIQHQAKQAGMTVTDYIITCALGKEIVRVDGLDEILAEVKAQGRNLNQLTTLANMGRIQVLRSDELINGYADLCQKLLRISREVQ